MSTICGWKYLGEGVQIYDPCVVLRPEAISIGAYSRVDALTKLEGGEGVIIGERVHIASHCHINAGGGRVEFGSHSGCATGVKILSGHPDLSYGHVCPNEPPELVHSVRYTTKIGQFVVIFAGAIICPGVTIGDFAVVAAGAVVTHDVGPFEIVSGNPAKFLRWREVIVR